MQICKNHFITTLFYLATCSGIDTVLLKKETTLYKFFELEDFYSEITFIKAEYLKTNLKCFFLNSSNPLI